MAIRTITVASGQTLPDIAVQHCGDVAAWSEIAQLNSLGLTAEITSGQSLIVPDVYNKRNEQFIRVGGYRPAVGPYTVLEGIDYWAIGYDFIVS